MSELGRLPRWLKPANSLVVVLEQRLGLKLGTIHTITAPGRASGKPRTTPVSLLTVNGERYLVAGQDDADWVKNVRASGWGILGYGRTRERVSLAELQVAERAPILREFPRRVPHGVPFFTRVHGVGNDPEAFAALSPKCPVFLIKAAPAA